MNQSLSKILTFVLLFCVGVVLSSIVHAAAIREEDRSEITAKKNSSLTEKKWGIKAVSLRRSAGGYMIDFRYQVTDPESASILLDRKTKPYLIDQATGTQLFIPNMPKVGSLKNTVVNPDVNKTYFMLFGNSSGLVKSGSKVTIVIGDFREENLVVK